jgi:hypothetical protein
VLLKHDKAESLVQLLLAPVAALLVGIKNTSVCQRSFKKMIVEGVQIPLKWYAHLRRE